LNSLKKVYLSGLTLVLLLGWVNPCTAYENSWKTMEFGVKSFYYDYNEVQSGEWLDSEKGWLAGTNFIFKSQNRDNGYWQIVYEPVIDNTHYNGFYLGTNQPSQSTTATELTTLEFTYANPVNENTYVSVGLGYHSWDRILSEYQEEVYSWFYIPLGFRWTIGAGRRLEGAIDISARIMFAGRMAGRNMGYKDFYVNLGNKPGYRIALPLTYHLNSLWAFTITPWYDYSSIGKSNSVPWYQRNGSYEGEVYEPDSTTKQYGINIGTKLYF
jgi:hypothetical protein